MAELEITCPICFQNRILYSLICHVSHRICLECYHKIGRNCPICRTTIKTIYVHSEYVVPDYVRNLARFQRAYYSRRTEEINTY
jgi:hypothetical protein